MATLKDVAKETGLTVTTVSRVLNNRGYISQNAKTAVYSAMERLNYSPNEVARLLSKKNSSTIGVIVPHIRHPYFADLISDIENYASKKGYKILLCNSREKDEKEREYFKMCVSNRVAGIILCSGSVETREFKGGDFPIVTIERHLDNGIAAIECDNYDGGKLAAEHLIECKCKNVLHFSGIFFNDMPADSRTKGFVDVCKKSNIKYREVATSQKEYSDIEYYDILKAELIKDKTIDGIFASSDVIAAQVLQVCYTLGKSVPRDLKIVGFDDVMIASLTTPRLTTISQPLKEMAKAAVEAVIDTNKGQIVPKKTVLPVKLIKREST